jgi:hypothetical protein
MENLVFVVWNSLKVWPLNKVAKIGFAVVMACTIQQLCAMTRVKRHPVDYMLSSTSSLLHMVDQTIIA